MWCAYPVCGVSIPRVASVSDGERKIRPEVTCSRAKIMGARRQMWYIANETFWKIWLNIALFIAGGGRCGMLQTKLFGGVGRCGIVQTKLFGKLSIDPSFCVANSVAN